MNKTELVAAMAEQTQIFCLWSTMPVIKIHKTYAFPRKNNVMLVTVPVTYLLPVFFTESS